MRIQPLDEISIKNQGWDDVYLKGHSDQVHIFRYHHDKSSKNIMILHTLVIPVKACFECYEQLGRIYHFNVFALDYVPGEGECSGTAHDFTLSAMVHNIDAAYNYIQDHYSDEIHLLGYTGAGAIFAQYYLGTKKPFRSFAQFACVNYKKTNPFGVPSIMSRPVLSLCKLIAHINANLTITYRPPKAKGFHAGLDNEFYDTITNRVPGFFSLKINHITRMLEIMIHKNSLLKNSIACPTLVFKTLHDRFFSKEYFDAYYASLTCEKKLVEINDIHNSYFITPEPFMKEIANWFYAH